MISQFFIFLLAVIGTSIVLTFIGRYIWFFLVVKLYYSSPLKKVCIWKRAFSTAFLMHAIDGTNLIHEA